MPKTPSQDELNKLGARLRPLVDAGIAAKGQLPIRWEKTEAFFDNAPPSEDSSDDKIVKIHVNFSSIRTNALTAKVCGVIAKQEPYMIAKEYQSGDRAERLEKVVHFFWERAEFEKLLRKAAPVAANTNKAIWKLAYRDFNPDEPDAAVIVLEVVHPDNWVCVPALPDGIKVAKLCGNRFWRRRRWIVEGIMDGTFLKPENPDSLVATTMESADETRSALRARISPDSVGVEHDDDLIEIWDLTVKLDTSNLSGDTRDKPKAEKWCRVMLALENQQVLVYEELEYSRPMYFESIFKADEKNYWSGRSVGYDLQGLQETSNLLWSALYNGVMNEAMPLVIGSGLPEKFSKYGYGDILDAKDLTTQPWAAPSRMSAAPALMTGIQAIDRIGDQSARISQNSMGSVVGNTTATEQSIVGQGVAEGQEEYISNFTSDFANMAKCTVELLKIHQPDWLPIFALRPQTQMSIDPMSGQPIEVPVPDPNDPSKPLMTGMIDIQPQDLDSKSLWEVTGKSPSSTPQAKLQAAQLILQAASTLPDCGGDVYEIFKLIVRSAGMSADGVQIPKDQLPGQQLLNMLKQLNIDPMEAMQFIQGLVNARDNPDQGQAGGATASLGTPPGGMSGSAANAIPQPGLNQGIQ